MRNLYAWCIIPYDSMNRTPVQRLDMLSELGFSGYAYDWREQHLAETVNELRLAKEKNIRVVAVWLWIDRATDSADSLSPSNEKMLAALAETKYKTQIWVGFNSNYFEDMEEREKIYRGVAMIRYLHSRAETMGCRIALYNHGDWFGEPDNQIKILSVLDTQDIGIIYNFHHGHKQVEDFPGLLNRMMPWLWGVNINGMKKQGPQILPLGSGSEERKMINTLLGSAYQGPIGILGHTEGEDVRTVLQRNLDGLKKLLGSNE